MGEIRTVDDDEKVGIGRHDSVRGGGDPSEDRRKPGDDRREAHHGNVFEGRDVSPLPRHGVAADAAPGEIGVA